MDVNNIAYPAQLRGDYEEIWEKENPVIQEREIILIKKEKDDPFWLYLKIGDGVSHYKDLPLWQIPISE